MAHIDETPQDNPNGLDQGRPSPRRNTCWRKDPLLLQLSVTAPGNLRFRRTATLVAEAARPSYRGSRRGPSGRRVVCLHLRHRIKQSKPVPFHDLGVSACMARITVEDCVLRVPSRFELVMVSAQRARDISAGAPALDRPRQRQEPGRGPARDRRRHRRPRPSALRADPRPAPPCRSRARDAHGPGRGARGADPAAGGRDRGADAGRASATASSTSRTRTEPRGPASASRAVEQAPMTPGDTAELVIGAPRPRPRRPGRRALRPSAAAPGHPAVRAGRAGQGPTIPTPTRICSTAPTCSR